MYDHFIRMNSQEGKVEVKVSDLETRYIHALLHYGFTVSPDDPPGTTVEAVRQRLLIELTRRGL